MIVYGDLEETVEAGAACRGLRARRARPLGLPAGPLRHDALVNLLIEAGRYVQALADVDFDPEHGDEPSPELDAWMAWLTDCAHGLLVSRHGEAPAAPCPLPNASSDARLLRLRTPEGYAFYGLHPENFIAAAETFPWRGPGVRVIGLRSIGASLAPVVAAALNAPAPITLRPFGHPFDRKVRLPLNRVRRLLDSATGFVIVDEGPGLSGSSFAAAARFLLAHGAAPDRITLLPSHNGPLGAAASAETRALWSRLRVEPARSLPGDVLKGHLAATLSEAITNIREMSGGVWRAERFDRTQDWPAVDPRTDRRKLLLQGASGQRYLARYIGLGASGERKLDRARRLADMGDGVPVTGAAQGYLIQPWIDAAQDLPIPPPAVAGAYIARRRELPSAPVAPADPQTLASMALANTTEALGPAAARALEHCLTEIGPPSASAPHACDGALQPWKWIWNGRWLKADALDHDADHDLIGPQGVEWDLVGAAIELGYDAPARRALLAAVGGPPPSMAAMAFLEPCYLAFQLGARTMAAARWADGSAERLRCESAAASYAGALRRRLDRPALPSPRTFPDRRERWTASPL